MVQILLSVHNVTGGEVEDEAHVWDMAPVLRHPFVGTLGGTGPCPPF